MPWAPHSDVLPGSHPSSSLLPLQAGLPCSPFAHLCSAVLLPRCAVLSLCPDVQCSPGLSCVLCDCAAPCSHGSPRLSLLPANEHIPSQSQWAEGLIHPGANPRTVDIYCTRGSGCHNSEHFISFVNLCSFQISFPS